MVVKRLFASDGLGKGYAYCLGVSLLRFVRHGNVPDDSWMHLIFFSLGESLVALDRVLVL